MSSSFVDILFSISGCSFPFPKQYSWLKTARAEHVDVTTNTFQIYFIFFIRFISNGAKHLQAYCFFSCVFFNKHRLIGINTQICSLVKAFFFSNLQRVPMGNVVFILWISHHVERIFYFFSDSELDFMFVYATSLKELCKTNIYRLHEHHSNIFCKVRY